MLADDELGQTRESFNPENQIPQEYQLALKK